jgi:hypothetical protein
VIPVRAISITRRKILKSKVAPCVVAIISEDMTMKIRKWRKAIPCVAAAEGKEETVVIILNKKERENSHNINR